MIPDEEIETMRDRVLYRDFGPYHLGHLLAERELLVKEHRAMLPLIHGDIEKGAIDPLFEAWGQVEAFK